MFKPMLAPKVVQRYERSEVPWPSFQRAYGLVLCVVIHTHTVPKTEEGDLSNMYHGEGNGMMHIHV